MFFCIFLVCILLSGCSFRLASSIDDLISPISPFGDNADIQLAMDSFAKNGYSLKTPSNGKYITSYNFYDIDGDKSEEAITFYEPNDNLGTIDMAILKKIDSTWKVIESIKGDGKDVYSLDFCDVNGDKKDEIIVCWDVISNSSNHELSIYRIDSSKESLKKIGDSVNINNYICVDMNNDNIDELLMFSIDTGNSTRARARLYSIAKNTFNLLGETKLDSHITSYSSLKIEKAENDVRVYADAIGSDGASMLTEVIYWSDNYDTIVSPFYSYSTGLTKDTSRSAMITSMDVNNDKLIEIPTDKKIKGMSKQINAVDWNVYKNTTLIHTDYSLLVKRDNYLIIIPDDIFNSINAKYDEKSRVMTVINKKTKKEIFSVMPVLKAVYDSVNFSDYHIVLEDSGYYYLAETGSDSDIKITIEQLKKLIKNC